MLIANWEFIIQWDIDIFTHYLPDRESLSCAITELELVKESAKFFKKIFLVSYLNRDYTSNEPGISDYIVFPLMLRSLFLFFI